MIPLQRDFPGKEIALRPPAVRAALAKLTDPPALDPGRHSPHPMRIHGIQLAREPGLGHLPMHPDRVTSRRASNSVLQPNGRPADLAGLLLAPNLRLDTTCPPIRLLVCVSFFLRIPPHA